MSMFNTGDILETIEMFTQDNLEKSNLRRSDADSWDTFRRKSHFIPH